MTLPCMRIVAAVIFFAGLCLICTKNALRIYEVCELVRRTLTWQIIKSDAI